MPDDISILKTLTKIYLFYFIFPGNLPCIQPSLFSSGSIDCCLDMAHNSNAVTSLPHVYHFLLFLCYFTNAYLPLVEKEKQKEIKKWDISTFIAWQSTCASWKKKKNHQKCEGLICCFLKINYCSWEAWYHSVLIQIPLNMTFIHLFKILMLPTVYGILKSAVIYLMFKWTHILIIFTYRCLISIMWKMDGPYCILFFTSLILFLSLTSFSFCKNRTS